MKPKPDWIRSRFRTSSNNGRVRQTLSETDLNTVCEEAACPNRGDCWGKGTATFLILGEQCSRECRFCGVGSAPDVLPPGREPERVARAVAELGLDYVVITSVTRDDLPDRGAFHWARTVQTVQKQNPDVKIEALVPDFGGEISYLGRVLQAEPDVLSHNVETVPGLYSRVRPGASYERSLDLLARASRRGFPTKSGVMLGLGESEEEITQVIRDLYESGVRYLTLGQYLRPDDASLPVKRWVEPEEFENWRNFAESVGFTGVEAGPLVRSSYHAESQVEELTS